MYDLITKKRDGQVLEDAEIRYIVEGFTKGDIPDYQMSAFLMAVFYEGMNDDEILSLTTAMAESGDMADLSPIEGIKVDKHSTGGVGDKTTLIVAPIVAANGVKVAKMSGRGLGFTGGTVDKLESIPGFHTAMQPKAFFKQVNEVGISVISQTAHVAPADKKLYALSDVTATDESMGLISSSIMSKKLASGSDAILLDVKCGSGALMKTREDARLLAETMCKIGASDGKKTVAALTDMSQPLGLAVGNSCEVIEAIETLKGRGPKDLEELAIHLAGIMICIGGKAKDENEGMAMAKAALEDGSGLEMFRKLVKAQGGNPDITENYKLLPQPWYILEIKADRDGYISRIDAMGIGLASQHAGAGRAKKEDSIDLSAGIVLAKKVGDKVQKGDIMARVFGNTASKVDTAKELAEESFSISAEKCEPPKLIKEIIGL
jgi:pyrimidine-nucleoside phosphorylase